VVKDLKATQAAPFVSQREVVVLKENHLIHTELAINFFLANHPRFIELHCHQSFIPPRGTRKKEIGFPSCQINEPNRLDEIDLEWERELGGQRLYVYKLQT
jgi:hypothetical protein